MPLKYCTSKNLKPKTYEQNLLGKNGKYPR